MIFSGLLVFFCGHCSASAPREGGGGHFYNGFLTEDTASHHVFLFLFTPPVPCNIALHLFLCKMPHHFPLSCGGCRLTSCPRGMLQVYICLSFLYFFGHFLAPVVEVAWYWPMAENCFLHLSLSPILDAGHTLGPFAQL